jgi:hypothetical protein
VGATTPSPAASDLGRREFGVNGFGRAWLALTVAFALHVLDEATTGFPDVYNPTVTAMRARWAGSPCRHSRYFPFSDSPPFGDVLASGAGILLVAIAVAGVCLADDTARANRIRIPVCRPCRGTSQRPQTVGIGAPEVDPILCYDR